MLLESL